MATTSQHDGGYLLRWNYKSIDSLLRSNGIRTRTELANLLGVARSTVYKAFDEHWRGEPSIKMLAEMSGHFRVPISLLVIEPGRGAAQRGTRGVNVRKAG